MASGLSSFIVAAYFLVSIGLWAVCAAPTAEETQAIELIRTTEAVPVTTEELEFKDVPIYEKDKLPKPAPGYKYVAVLKCSGTGSGASDDQQASAPSDGKISHAEKTAHENIHDPYETVTKDVQPAGQTPVEGERHDAVVDDNGETKLDVAVATETKPTSELVSADHSKPEMSADIANVGATVDETSKDEPGLPNSAVPVDQDAAALEPSKSNVVQPEEVKPQQASDEVPQTSLPAEVLSTDDAPPAGEEVVKIAPVVQDDPKINQQEVINEGTGETTKVESDAIHGNAEPTPEKPTEQETLAVPALSSDTSGDAKADTVASLTAHPDGTVSSAEPAVEPGTMKDAAVSLPTTTNIKEDAGVVTLTDFVVAEEPGSSPIQSAAANEENYGASGEENIENVVDIEPDVVKDFTGYKVYRVVITTEEAARWILKFEDVPGIEFWADPKLLLRPRGLFVTSAADMLVAPDVVEYIEEALRQARLPYEILIKDVQEAIRNENPSEPEDADELASRNGHRLTWERYHSLDDIDSYLEYLKITYPDFVTITEIGRTTEDRPIKAVRLHQNSGRANKKAILIDAGIHAREWITPATITYIIREIVDNPQKYECIMNEFDWIFVPVLNPDGYTYTQSYNRMWRKTRSRPESIVFRKMSEATLRADRLARFEDDPILDDAILEKLRAEVASNKASLSCTGADANRNFDYHWLTGGSSRNPCSDIFAGAKPFSEPESRALRDLVLENKDQLAMYISLHAYSQMWLIPWGYKQEKPEDFSDLYSLAKIGSKALETVNGVSYMIGSIPDLLYIASGSSIDWVKGATGVKYCYTLELRDSGRYGFLLPANQIIPSGKETWIALHATAVELAQRVYSDPAACPAI